MKEQETKIQSVVKIFYAKQTAEILRPEAGWIKFSDMVKGMSMGRCDIEEKQGVVAIRLQSSQVAHELMENLRVFDDESKANELVVKELANMCNTLDKERDMLFKKLCRLI